MQATRRRGPVACAGDRLVVPANGLATMVTCGGAERMGLYTIMHDLTPEVVRSRRFGVVFNVLLPDRADV